MNILDLSVDKRLEGYKPARRRTLGDPGTVPAGLMGNGSGKRPGFAAAASGRLLNDFFAASRSADQTLYGDNKRLRARGNELALNNPFIRKFLAMLPQNVIGAAGILMQAKVTGVNGKKTAYTDIINARIEKAWKDWCESCCVDGRSSFVDLEHLSLKNCGREGENLEKFVLGRQFNEVGLALQPLDNDQLDDTMMQSLGNGGEIRMGVEVDMYRRPLAYHLFTGNPADMLGGGRERKRIPAEFIVHNFRSERPGQTRGYSWFASVMLTAHQRAGWSEATLVAARASAAKPFAIQKEYPPDGYYAGEEEGDGAEDNGTNADGTLSMSANTGEGYVLDQGESLNFFDPRFPTNTYSDFSKELVRELATGMLVSYPALGNDLSDVNFSSMRGGLLDERDGWRVLQNWIIGSRYKRIFARWIDMACLTVLSDLTITPEQRKQIEWRPRGWEWVDPVKDADAAILRLANGFSTYSRELAQFGLDFEETIDERAKEQAYIESMQAKHKLRAPLMLGTDLAGDQGGTGVGAGDEEAATAPASGDAPSEDSLSSGKQAKGAKT